MDRETLSLPVANSQFYTNAVSSITNMLSPITQSTQSIASVDRDSKESITTNLTSSPAPSISTIVSLSNAPLFELTEEVSYIV